MAGQALRVGRDLSPEERRTAILRAAVDCVAEIGHDNVRLRDVAKSAGVSVGMLQHYFESREELIAETFRQATEDVLREWHEVADTNPMPWERLASLVGQLALRDKLRTHSMLWVDFANAAARTSDIREQFRSIYQSWYALVRDTIESGVETGIFAPIAPVPDVVEMLLNHIDGCELNVASHPDAMSGLRMRDLTLRLASTLLQYDPANPPEVRAREVSRSTP